MKSKYWAILLGAALAVCLGLSFLLMGNSQTAARAEISSNGQVIRTVELAVDQEFTVTAENGGTNTITVKDGAIAVTAADCPDHYCMDRGFCSGGTQIVCLPNRLVIRFLGGQEIDGMAG